MIITKLKSVAENIPYPIGRLTSRIPYSWRLGSAYSEYSRQIPHIENANPEQRNAYVVKMLDSIVRHAQQNIPFYQSLYGKDPLKIESLSDFEMLPVISRKQVREYARVSSGAYFLNTGGSTGEPLFFYVDRNAWAREWAHMHYIWGLRGYKHKNLMITMLGKNLGSVLLKYNAVHNEIRINPYLDIRSRVLDIVRLFTEYPIRYFQGYPSAIYNFFRELEPVLNEEEKKHISSKIKSCFFSSEYPLPYMVDYLRDVWSLNFISWYGHSEMCVLAYDNKNTGEYKPFVTYGFMENVNGTLCGTSFHNYDMPLIRYSTGDVIESCSNDLGLVDSFRISAGREGDFIEDTHGKKIPLTAVLFGRHHKIFNIADHVQVFQEKAGSATFYVSFKNDIHLRPNDLSNYFDMSNLCIEFDYIILRNPIRTKGGKLKLRLTSDDVYESKGLSL